MVSKVLSEVLIEVSTIPHRCYIRKNILQVQGHLIMKCNSRWNQATCSVDIRSIFPVLPQSEMASSTGKISWSIVEYLCNVIGIVKPNDWYTRHHSLTYDRSKLFIFHHSASVKLVEAVFTCSRTSLLNRIITSTKIKLTEDFKVIVEVPDAKETFRSWNLMEGFRSFWWKFPENCS